MSTLFIVAFVLSGCSISAKEIVPPTPLGDKCIVVYMPHASTVDESRKDNLIQALDDVDFEEIVVATNEKDLQSGLAVCAHTLVVYQAEGTPALASDFAENHLRSFLQAGGFVITSSGIQLPLEKWIAEDAKVERVSAIRDNRNTASTNEGNWLHTPHDLDNAVVKGVSPLSGFMPVGDGWEVLADRTPDNDVDPDVPYLLRYKLGTGHFVLTSSPLGLGGGGEMFGNVNVGNAAKLIANLLAEMRSE